MIFVLECPFGTFDCVVLFVTKPHQQYLTSYSANVNAWPYKICCIMFQVREADEKKGCRSIAILFTSGEPACFTPHDNSISIFTTCPPLHKHLYSSTQNLINLLYWLSPVVILVTAVWRPMKSYLLIEVSGFRSEGIISRETLPFYTSATCTHFNICSFAGSTKTWGCSY